MSEPGFLNDLGLHSVSADPNAIPDGKHPGYVAAIKIQEPNPTSNNNHRALIITYKIDENHPDLNGRSKTEYKTMPNMVEIKNDLTGEVTFDFATPEDSKHASYLKQRMLSLGVPEQELGNVQIEQITGTPVWFTVAARGEYHNIVAVSVREEQLPTAQELNNLI
jgi:hypothetical protein